jgi:hypothetical protein
MEEGQGQKECKGIGSQGSHDVSRELIWVAKGWETVQRTW